MKISLQQTPSRGLLVLLVTLSNLGLANSVNSSTQNQWPKSLPPLKLDTKNYRRSIIHIHSNFSHDACDNKPFKDGKPNELCYKDFLASFCDLNTDIVFVTEHADSMANFPFEDIWHSQAGDTPIMEEGQQTGVIRTCGNGHRVHFYLGAENNLMPIGLTKHPAALGNQSIKDAYMGMDPEAIKAFKDAGALVGTAHTEHESKSLGYLNEAKLDFLEIYNTHAEFLILKEKKSYLSLLKLSSQIYSFADDASLEPDLVFLNLQTENQLALDRWASVALSQHITGTAGTDAHQNSLPKVMSDGERIDSYRRMQRWFSNYVDVENPGDRKAVLKAIKDGKNLVVFEIYGVPNGFDFAVVSEKTKAEMGEEVQMKGENYKVSMIIPQLSLDGSQSIANAKLKGRILKATPRGWVTVAEGTNSPIEYSSSEPGVYRAEVRVLPHYLLEFLPSMPSLIKERVWIYSNPIWVH